MHNVHVLLTVMGTITIFDPDRDRDLDRDRRSFENDRVK